MKLGLKPGRPNLREPWETAGRRGGRIWDIQGFLQHRAGSRNKRGLGSLKSFLWPAPPLSGPVSRVFTARGTHWLSSDCICGCPWPSLSLTTDRAEIPPKEEKGAHQDRIKGRGRCSSTHIVQSHIWQKFVAHLLKVVTSLKEQTSPWRLLVSF